MPDEIALSVYVEMKTVNPWDRIRAFLPIGGESRVEDPAGGSDHLRNGLAVSKADQFAHLLSASGGRMKQSTLVSETEWSAGTVSRMLSEMEADGLITKTRVGRENVITLTESEKAWYDPPDVAGESITGRGTLADDAAGDRAILLVEDDPQAVRLITEAFEEAGIPNPIHVIHDGLDALDFLLQRGTYTDAPRPALVLLDLGLLVVDGTEVLGELDQRRALRGVPVLVLSQSDAPADVRNSYDSGATAYLTKPNDFEGLVDLAEAIDTFWLTHVVPVSAQTNPSDRRETIGYPDVG